MNPIEEMRDLARDKPREMLAFFGMGSQVKNTTAASTFAVSAFHDNDQCYWRSEKS
jgi:hypothetical protein